MPENPHCKSHILLSAPLSSLCPFPQEILNPSWLMWKENYMSNMSSEGTGGDGPQTPILPPNPPASLSAGPTPSMFECRCCEPRIHRYLQMLWRLVVIIPIFPITRALISWLYFPRENCAAKKAGLGEANLATVIILVLMGDVLKAGLVDVYVIASFLFPIAYRRFILFETFHLYIPVQISRSFNFTHIDVQWDSRSQIS